MKLFCAAFCAVFCVLLSAQATYGYHILCIFALPSHSNKHLGAGIVRALLKGGHEVTWVTPYPPSKTEKGLHVIDASATRPFTEEKDMLNSQSMSFGEIRRFSSNVSAVTARLPALRHAVEKGGFDAVVTELFFSEVTAGYAAVLQVPWILLSGLALQAPTEALVDGVTSVPIVPFIFNDAGVPMSFVERLKNVGLYNLLGFMSWWYRAESEREYQELFAPLAASRNVPLPPLYEIYNNVSILFTNSHPSFGIAQSAPPNVVEIGGYHIDETVVPLPKDLQDILDSSPQGVIYFSMGSILKSSLLPEHVKQGLLQMFSELPYTVLWKVEKEMAGLPKNVHTREWMPQAAILEHKNTRVFITHGGLLSNIETIRSGVPTIAIPVFGDQPANAARAARAGYALKVDFDYDTLVEHLRAALKEALSTDKYYNRAKYLSSLFNKRPVSPVKLINHYVEVAIESKGAYHLRSKALLYHWTQRWMLDILALVLVVLLVIFIILKTVVKAIIKLLFGSKQDKKKLKKN